MTAMAGTDTYGRVKAVDGTPIVTKFFMLQGIPITPQQSYYFRAFGAGTTAGIPFVAETQSVSIQGIPLAKLDRLSVAMAYVRAFFALLTVVGFIAIVPIISYFTGERLDSLGRIITAMLISFFIVGIIGGSMTYLLPLTPRREQAIRSYCGELLGISADPARLSAEDARMINAYISQQDSQSIDDLPRDALLRELIGYRTNIAEGIETAIMEERTDHTLNRLNRRQN